MNDIKEYLKELQQLKNTGVLDDEQSAELDNLVKIMQSLENQYIEEDNQTQTPYINIESNDLHKLQIKFVNTSDNPDPTWAKEGDSGFDLRACLPNKEKEVILQPFERMLIPTGLYFELPMGYELQIRPRSGHSFKTGLMVILGTVDTGYRGEIKVIMINLSNEPQKIEAGERVAQGVVASRVSTEFGKLIKLESIKELSETERGSGGFGSTGKN
jgi:dUTP pyrophosphatase